MPGVDERRRLTAMILLFAIGFGLVALASAVSDVWPLFVTPLPYAAIAWLVVRAGDDDLARTGSPGTTRPSADAQPRNP
jgi:hypothetical protein